MERGASVAKVSRSGETASSLAQKRGYENIINLIRDSGDKNATLNKSETWNSVDYALRICSTAYNFRFSLLCTIPFNVVYNKKNLHVNKSTNLTLCQRIRVVPY